MSWTEKNKLNHLTLDKNHDLMKVTMRYLLSIHYELNVTNWFVAQNYIKSIPHKANIIFHFSHRFLVYMVPLLCVANVVGLWEMFFMSGNINLSIYAAYISYRRI